MSSVAGRRGQGWEAKAAVIAFFLLLIGFFVVYSASFDKSVTGALIGVIALILGAALGVVSAVSNYRRTMRRSWPKVPRVKSDDEEE